MAMKKSEAQIKEEIANIQILVRVICIPLATLSALHIGGILASKFSYASVSLFIPVNTIISIIGAILVTKEPATKLEKINKNNLLFSSLYILGLLSINFFCSTYNQEATLITGLTVVSYSLYRLCRQLPIADQKNIFAILIVCFFMRASPDYGPSVEWWKIDILKFDPEFFAQLKQINLLFGFLGIWMIGRSIAKIHMGKACLIICIINFVLQLPYIGMAFGLHEWTMSQFGFGAKSIALVDVTAMGFFSQIEFFLVCTLATYKAPKNNLAMWFALSMSLMSLGIVFKRIIMRTLAQIYLVERSDYHNIPDLMIFTTLIAFIMPAIFILIFMNPFKKSSQ
jgi:hypothetical protein